MMVRILSLVKQQASALISNVNAHNNHQLTMNGLVKKWGRESPNHKVLFKNRSGVMNPFSNIFLQRISTIVEITGTETLH